jgi:diguanylate cyclase (GGDEF)-like protein
MIKFQPRDIQEDIYTGFVRSLFKDPAILLIGALCHGFAGLIVYLKSETQIYLVLSILMLLAGLARYWAIRRVDANEITDFRSAVRMERYYIIFGTIQGLVVGTFGFTAIYIEPDIFAEIAAVSVVMGGAVTIAGRNYGSRAMVVILTLTAVGPIAAALMLKGDIYHFALGLFIVPFMIIITKMAELVRMVLFTAIQEEKKATRLAERFDRALNTMSHGLIMFSREGRAVVANHQAAQALLLKSPEAVLGRTLKALLMRALAGGLLSINDFHFAETQLGRALRDGRGRKLLVSFADGRHFEFSAREGNDELGVITFEDVTGRIEAEEKVRYMARYDRLTGLPNRAYFHEIVTDAMAVGDPCRKCALAVFDLDDFKSINDTLGHPVGDGLIYAVGEKLAGFASSDIKVSRFGGDEFMIYFDEVEDEDHLALLLDSIFEQMHGEIDVAGHSLRYQVSAGAVLAPVDESDVDGMIVKADLALYKAKELGKNNWKLFEASMDAAFRSRQVMKADLRSAIEARALRVVYQPIIDMRTMCITSCEALCRWDHAELGPVAPSVFIPLAEEMGIISDISTFVLEQACADCARWPDHISVSVNLSTKDFRSHAIAEKIARVLAETNLKPDRLQVEVTETALLDDASDVGSVLEALKALGVSIALDDFGTGYSSLSYLHKLPLDKVKIDQSFLIDVTLSERSLELLKGIVNLSRPLGLQVTIEGVETFEQLKVLSTHIHPDLVQGYLFGSALTASGIAAMSNTVWPFARDLSKDRYVARA